LVEEVRFNCTRRRKLRTGDKSFPIIRTNEKVMQEEEDGLVMKDSNQNLVIS
jgi:hypothetical protein